MNKKFATALFAAAASTGFTQDITIDQPSSALPLEVVAVEKMAENHSFTYVRMGLSDSNPIREVQTLPGLGLGYRYSIADGAIDVSANYTRETSKGSFDNYFYTVPKVSYLHYVSPVSEQSFYLGAGLAYGALKKSDGASFQGVVPSASVGYEMNRNSAVRSFVQLDVSQPTMRINNWNDYAVKDLPAPVAEASFGLGF
jgi:hypothetical protein